MSEVTMEEKLATVCQRINYINSNERILSDSITKHRDQLMNLEDMYIQMLSSVIDFKNVIKRIQENDLNITRDISDISSRCDIVDDLVDIINVMRKRIELLERCDESNSWVPGRVNSLTHEIDEIKSKSRCTKNMFYIITFTVIAISVYISYR